MAQPTFSPPKNRTCEFPRIRLKWRRPFPSRLGKRFAVAKLTASLSARAKLRPRLLVASGRLIPSPEIQVSTGKDLLIPRGRAGLEASYLSPISPGTLKGEPSLFGSSSAQCGTPPFFGSNPIGFTLFTG